MQGKSLVALLVLFTVCSALKCYSRNGGKVETVDCTGLCYLERKSTGGDAIQAALQKWRGDITQVCKPDALNAECDGDDKGGIYKVCKTDLCNKEDANCDD